MRISFSQSGLSLNEKLVEALTARLFAVYQSGGGKLSA